MLSFFVELFFDISGSDRCVQFLFLGAKLHRFPHRRTIFSPFSQPKRPNIDARQTSDLYQDAPSGHYINGYNNGSLVSFFELWLLSASDWPSRCQWYAFSLKLTMQLRCKVNAEASSLGLRWAAARSRRCIFITTAKVQHSHCGSRMISKKFRFFWRLCGHLVIWSFVKIENRCCQNATII